MSKSKFSLEMHFRVYNDDNGECVKIGNDTDGLGLLEIGTSEADDYIRMTVEQARKAAEAISRWADFAEEQAGA